MATSSTTPLTTPLTTTTGTAATLTTTAPTNLTATYTTGIPALTSTGVSDLVAERIVNPYTGKTADQIQDIASGMTQQAATTGYTNADAGSTNYTADQGTVTNWSTADTNQMVANQLKDIVAADSPLMQQARTQALAQMNRRGLINSSMAVGAGQDAVIKNALPIATSDATTRAQIAKYAADAANQMEQFNTAATNTASSFNAGAKNAAALSNAAAENRAAEFTATAKNMSAADFAKNVNANVATIMDESMKIALSNADSDTKIALQSIDSATRKDLAATEATYKKQMGASQAANEIFQQSTKNISDLMQNPDLSAYATTDGKAPTTDKKNWPAGAQTLTNGILYDAKNIPFLSPKQQAVDMQKQSLKNALSILEKTSGVTGLDNLLTFSVT